MLTSSNIVQMLLLCGATDPAPEWQLFDEHQAFPESIIDFYSLWTLPLFLIFTGKAEGCFFLCTNPLNVLVAVSSNN